MAGKGLSYLAVVEGKQTEPKRLFVTSIIQRAVGRLGARLILEPEFGYVGHITFKNGKTTFFRNTNMSINNLGATEIARDKGYAAFFLSRFGYTVPEGQTFFCDRLCRHVTNPRTIHDGFRYASRLGFPVILKPNSRSQGRLVTKVYDRREYYRVARAILRIDSVMLVQRYCQGNDFRIVVLDDRVISAYQRLPLQVTGNGSSTIGELLRQKQHEFNAVGRDTVINAEDFRMSQRLRRHRLSLSGIPARGQRVQLLDNANLSAGGDAVDFTDRIHPEWVRLAIDVTKSMCLRLCGVDVLTDDISAPVSDHIILEINAAPGLDNYASIGKSQAELVDYLYESVLRALEGQ